MMTTADADSNQPHDRMPAGSGRFLAGRFLTGQFVTGKWSHVAILNYPANPSLLIPLLPRGVDLDLWNGQAFVSIVGLSFEHLRVLRVPVPFYRRFQQVNLRFYVSRASGEDRCKGVVFIKEFVPHRAMVAASRLLYNQRYCFARMGRRVETGPAHECYGTRCSSCEVPAAVEYCWQYSGRWNRMSVKAASSPEVPRAGSFEEFITRRHWGYSRRRGASLEFEVHRADWLVGAGSGSLDCDPASVFGKDFEGVLSDEPASAFWSPGSPIALSLATRFTSP